MDFIFAALPSSNTNDYRAVMAEATAPNTPVATVDIPFPHTVAQDITFIGLNPVSHYFYIYELIGGSLGALLTPPYLVQPNSQSIGSLPDIELNVGAGLDITPGSTAYDGTATYPQHIGKVAGVDYMIIQRSTGPLKSTEYTDVNDVTKFGFNLAIGDSFNNNDTFFIRFIPKIVVNPNNNSSLLGIGYVDIAEVTANATLDSTYLNKLIDINSNTNKISIVLDSIVNWPDMKYVGFKTDRGNQVNAIIQAAPGELIYYNGQEVNDMVMGKAEHLKLIKKGTRIHVELFDGDDEKVGTLSYGYIVGRNQIFANGGLLDRDVYVRAWRMVSQLTPGDGVVDEITWGTGELNKGNWSYGDGSTTFRAPLLHSPGFLKGVDGTARKAGSYQAQNTEDLFVKFDPNVSQDFYVKKITVPAWAANWFADDSSGDHSNTSTSTRTVGLEIGKMNNNSSTNPANTGIYISINI